ncbi:MAG: hypothetical protein N2Z74_00915 [Syntrophales bacterium]|nr:hypothetical protein [Syntrophales bacterium]
MATGEIHLCQPGADKSCGACCGLYNYADSTRSSLTERLRRRTALYRHNADRTVAGLLKFAAEVRRGEDQRKRYEVIYCCEYLGFLDDEEQRVGCLLHPLQNGGVDLREVSFYGRELCAGHLCPSYYYLTREEKQAVVACLDDWYLYGLVVTDIDFVKSYFRLIGEAIYETPKPDLFYDETLRACAHRFFSLKLTWPFRAEEVHRFGKYYFDGSQYMIHHTDYGALGCPPSPYERIFQSLTSVFHCAEQVRAAEETIEQHIDDFARLYENLRS